jgi:hypothetical protein
MELPARFLNRRRLQTSEAGECGSKNPVKGTATSQQLREIIATRKVPLFHF